MTRPKIVTYGKCRDCRKYPGEQGRCYTAYRAGRIVGADTRACVKGHAPKKGERQ